MVYFSKKEKVKEFLSRSYWILTVQREGNFSTETFVIEGNIIFWWRENLVGKQISHGQWK
jgi:hypothetical protein